MTEAEKTFHSISESLIHSHPMVKQGKMMSSPGLKYKNKVFCFYHNDQMIFRLGKNFDVGALGVRHFGFLSPFRTKPPMRAWFEIPFSESKSWQLLAQRALDKIEAEIRKS